MKNFKMLLSAGICCAAMAQIAVTSFAAQTGAAAGLVSTEASPLSVRAAASVSSQRLTALQKGSVVTLISHSGGWWYVKYADGSYGYCYDDYITPLQSSRAGYVDTAGGSLNIRTGASAASPVAARLEDNTPVVIISDVGSWRRVLYNGTQIGYASGSYISEQAPAQNAAYGAVRLSVADYKQYDSRWASLAVGASGRNMSSIGCVTTALADTESYRTGTALTPAAMLKRLSYNASGDVYWPSDYQKYTGSDYLKKTYELLKSQRPVIFGAKTASGRTHWVVVTGYSGGEKLSPSAFSVNDPGSSSRSTLSQLLSEYPYFYKLEYYN